MKRNYQLEMEKIISEMEGKPTLLLHSCCGPCSTSVLERLSEHFEIYLYYYNPNIEPEQEYTKRLSEQARLIKDAPFARNVHLICGEYDNSAFRKRAQGMESAPEGGARCEMCIRMRMEDSAKQAKKYGCEYFTTTLSVSPHKNAEYINLTGEELARAYAVKYLYADFKKKDGYRRSIELSKEYGVYRQDYCGCLFSKPEGEKDE